MWQVTWIDALEGDMRERLHDTYNVVDQALKWTTRDRTMCIAKEGIRFVRGEGFGTTTALLIYQLTLARSWMLLPKSNANDLEDMIVNIIQSVKQ